MTDSVRVKSLTGLQDFSRLRGQSCLDVSRCKKKRGWRFLHPLPSVLANYGLVAQSGHTGNQSARVWNRGYRGIASHHTNFSDAEATSTRLRNTTGDVRESIRTELSGRTGSSLLDDCKVVAALG